MNKKETIEELERQIRESNELIWTLRREAEFKEKEFKLEEEKLEIACTRANLNLQNGMSEAKIRIEEMDKRLKESPYKQLQDILKALVVKLPTLEIKELSVHPKEK